MPAYLIYAIGILLVILSLAYRNNKTLTVVLYIFLFIVFTFCNGGTSDLEVYKWTYKESIFVTAIGFDTIMKLFIDLGLPFVVFKAFCGAFMLFFLRKALRLCMKRENVVLALFIIFPFLDSVSQIRNGMMMAYVLFAILSYALDDKNRAWLYILRILLIALIHPVALIYLIFVLAKKNFKETNTLVRIVAFLLIVFVELCISQNLLYNIARHFISNEKYLSYFNYSYLLSGGAQVRLNLFGMMVYVVGQVMGYVFFCLVSDKYKKVFYSKGALQNGTNTTITIFTKKQMHMFNNMQLLLLFLLPFYQLTGSYFRVYKNILPITYILLAQVLVKPEEGNIVISQELFVVIVMVLIFLFISFYGNFFGLLNSFSFI